MERRFGNTAVRLTKKCDHFSHKAQQSLIIDAEVPYHRLNIYDCICKF